MEAGTLFRIIGDNSIYRVVSNPSGWCDKCCAYSGSRKSKLCKKLPDCNKIYFERLSFGDVKKAGEIVELILP